MVERSEGDRGRIYEEWWRGVREAEGGYMRSEGGRGRIYEEWWRGVVDTKEDRVFDEW